MLDEKVPPSVNYTYGHASSARDLFCPAAVLLDAGSEYGFADPRLADLAVAHLPQGLGVFDGAGRLRLANALFAATVGLERSALPLGLSFRECWLRIFAVRTPAASPPHRAERAYRRHRELVRRKVEGKLVEIVEPDLAVEVCYKPLPGGAFLVTVRNVTQDRRMLQRMAALASRDPLTELANRKTFHERLARALRASGRGRRLALLQIDLDRFKSVNDLLGHQAGDRLLRIAAQRISALLPPGGLAARLGGDEFALILEGMSESDVANLAERIVGALSAPIALGQRSATVGASIGIAFAATHGTAADDLMLSCDLALYTAKSLGGSTVSVYTEEMADAFKGRMLLEAELRLSAQSKEGLSLQYQPISDARSGRVTAREALLRWCNPRLGPISPCSFIPLAEQLGVIAEIGAWALHQACRDAAAWPDAARVAVNVSPHQLGRGQLVEQVMEALFLSGLPADRLELEVTETALLSDDAAKIEDLARLRKIGVRVALDDFGTGFSSLAHVRAFPFDKIKVDGSFVRDAVERPDCAVIVGIVADLGRRLSMTVVAEGVETQAHLALARAQGCDEVQGYLLGRPVPQAEIMLGAGAAEAKARIA